MSRMQVAGICALLAVMPPRAFADEPDAQRERRDLPDYDGRPDAGPDALDVFLWVPRVALSPLYFVSEHVLRRPIGFVVTELERHEVIDSVVDFFTFGPDRYAGIVPTAFYEYGFRPSVGVYAYWNGFLVDENRISLHAATWGLDWLTLRVADRVRVTPDLDIVGRFEAVRRPDQIFGGVGSNATHSQEARYEIEALDASLRLRERPFRRSTFGLETGYRTASFESNPFDGDIGVADRGPPPPGFDSGYESFRIGASAYLDTREIRELPTGGVRAGGFLEQNVAFGGFPDSAWLRWGGAAMLATDALGQGRVLGLAGEVSFVTDVAADDPQRIVPFDLLVDAGGDGPLRGFRPGAIRGLSVAAVSVHYLWPIWIFVDAHLRATVGNAFGEHLAGFALERLRLSFDFGILPRVEGEHPFELLVGVGTQTFEDGTEIASVRFAIGARSGI